MSLQWGQVIYPAFDKNNKQETMERLHFGHDPFSKEEAGRFSCAVLSKEDGALDDRIAVVASNKRSYAGHPEQEHLCHVLILIKNKQKCRLVSVPMSRMELPCVRREVPPQQPEDSFINSDLDRSQVNQLTRTFGSKRSIRRSEIGLKVEQHTVDNKDELERTVLGIRQEDIIKGGDLSGGDSTILSILPPHDRSATQLSDIYKVEGLLSREEMNSLEAAAQFFIDNPPAKRDEEHSFFLSSHFKLVPTESKLEGMILLLYANTLLIFLKTPLKEMKKGYAATLCAQAPAIGDKIIKEFTVTGDKSRTRPAYMKDKVVCYVLVLVLLACDFIIDISLLMPFFKGIPQTKIKQLTKLVGIVPMFVGSKKYVFKLPLPPLPSIHRRRTR